MKYLFVAPITLPQVFTQCFAPHDAVLPTSTTYKYVSCSHRGFTEALFKRGILRVHLAHEVTAIGDVFVTPEFASNSLRLNFSQGSPVHRIAH
ncbi:hypothetical protein BKA82DRAFT_1001004 [Pisolithus tinctorius]|uniref:Uncharacterized protein n=1 Tax=Pisolithus tinctorius Marx 270 TaxID=870435 RepID=A0A0C3P852_PISTI|nr:hypothetical protein BKA82DRAFT_1001004 [Pisolithus tinctorius]KIO03836.1 hypothetical protein M404DRAFT_1001004 [Pisolithus tinctorius Marx 270]